MYQKTLKLKHAPFATTPDPRFFYPNAMYQNALERLMMAVSLRRGICAVIGEPGLGKSTLIRTMLGGLRETVHFAWIFNTTMDSTELLKFICRDFGFTPKSEHKSEILLELYTFFIREFENERIPLLIIDEAQNLTPSVLEEIRQLSNLETVNHKLVQIILSGQPQLEDHLDMAELVQLKQRITYKITLNRLSFAETGRYIQHRLGIAGAKDVNVFSEGAVKTIYDATGGIPRLINQACDHALISAIRKEKKSVDAIIIHELLEKKEIISAPEPRKKETLCEVPKKTVEREQITKVTPKSDLKKVIETNNDVFEAIDIADLISVI